MDARVIRQSDVSNNFSILNITSNSIEIGFDYMDSGEGVRLQVLHTNSINDLLFSCKLKGGKPIRNYRELKKDSGIRGVFRVCVDELFPMVGVLISMYSVIIILQLIGFQYKGHEILITFITMVVSGLMVFCYLKMKKDEKDRMFNNLVECGISKDRINMKPALEFYDL